MVKDKYDRMLVRFEEYYPYLYKQMVDWWPSGRHCITVKLSDGLLIEFDSIDNTFRKVKTDGCVKDAETLRKDIGHNLKKVLNTRSMTQSEIAEKCGITEAMLSRYIHGTSMPGVEKVYTLAAVLGCRITDLLGDSYES